MSSSKCLVDDQIERLDGRRTVYRSLISIAFTRSRSHDRTGVQRSMNKIKKLPH